MIEEIYESIGEDMYGEAAEPYEAGEAIGLIYDLRKAASAVGVRVKFIVKMVEDDGRDIGPAPLRFFAH